MKKINKIFYSLLFLSLVSCNINNENSNDQSTSESESTSESMSVSESESTSETINAYKVTFDMDEHVKVYVYSSQDYTSTPVEKSYAYSLDSTNFEYTLEEGQVNFKIVFDKGYALDSMQASEDNYKNIKGPSDTEADDVYRITKITGDFTLSISSKEEVKEEVNAYKVTFDTDEHVKVYVYSSQDYTTTPLESTYAYSLDKTEFKYTKVEGQINFLLVFDDGYELDSMIASETNYKNIKGEEETEVSNVYRITKISGDFTLVITSKGK